MTLAVIYAGLRSWLWCIIHKPENLEALDQDTSNDSQLHTLTCRNSQLKCTHKNTSNDFQLYTLTSKKSSGRHTSKYLVQVISDATPKSSTSAAKRVSLAKCAVILEEWEQKKKEIEKRMIREKQQTTFHNGQLDTSLIIENWIQSYTNL